MSNYPDDTNDSHPEHVDAPPAHIRIDRVHGGSDHDLTNLTSCYFQQVGGPGDYQLFQRGNDEPIPTAPSSLRSGTDFQFVRGGVVWTITKFEIGSAKASGNWFNTRRVEADEGTFQAQAGPVGEESAASASA
jgi:hypothetical protein